MYQYLIGLIGSYAPMWEYVLYFLFIFCFVCAVPDFIRSFWRK